MENTKPPMKDKETKESLEQLIEYFGDTIISDWTSNENGIKEADSLRVKRELIDFISKELDKAREDGRREQQRLDCELYGTAVATNEEIEEKWNLSKLKNNDNMEVKEKMSEDFIRGYNEAIRDILAKRGMWAGADKKLLQELSNYLKEEK